MNHKKELLLPYCVAGILLFVSVVCYAGFSKEAPVEPERSMFQCVAGKVLFSHKAHTSEAGYGIACADCHHHPEDAEDSLGCAECHVMPEDGTMAKACLECHEPDEFDDLSSVLKKSDALHNQCIGCHKEKDAGPQECAQCHVTYSF